MNKLKVLPLLIALSFGSAVAGPASEELTTVTEKAYFLINGKPTRSYIIPGNEIFVNSIDANNIASIIYYPQEVIAKIEGHTLVDPISITDKIISPKVETMVAASRAYFYLSPNAGALGRQYVISGDKVSVSERKNGFSRINYVGKSGQDFNTWVKSGALATRVSSQATKNITPIK